jgi:hypothetical protein
VISRQQERMQALQAWRLQKEQQRRAAEAAAAVVAPPAVAAPAAAVRMAGELPNQVPAVAAAIEGAATPQAASSVMDSWKAQIARQAAGTPATSTASPREAPMSLEALNAPANPAAESAESFVARRMKGLSEEQKAPGYDKLASKLRMEYGEAVRKSRAPAEVTYEANPALHEAWKEKQKLEAVNMADHEIYMAKRKAARDRGGKSAEKEVIKDRIIRQIGEDMQSGAVPLVPTEDLSEDMWRQHRARMEKLDIDEQMVVQEAMSLPITRSYLDHNSDFNYEDQMNGLAEVDMQLGQMYRDQAESWDWS